MAPSGWKVARSGAGSLVASVGVEGGLAIFGRADWQRVEQGAFDDSGVRGVPGFACSTDRVRGRVEGSYCVSPRPLRTFERPSDVTFEDILDKFLTVLLGSSALLTTAADAP